jgi:23S rRNA-/tRNA-specific pseudouridylate synthase
MRRRCLDADLSSAQIESALWHGGLHLGGRPCPATALPAEVPADTRVVLWAFEREPDPVELPEDAILLDEDGIVAVNKPAWSTVQSTRASQRLGLEPQLRDHLACPALAAVHRLDRGTSGVVLFARDRVTAARLGRALAHGRIEKRYLALTSPPSAEPHWEVTGFVARAAHPRRIAFALHDEPGPGRRASHTRFHRLGVRNGAALVRAEPQTGRTHQIRLHLARGGTPIVGDSLYGGLGDASARLQLHALALRLPPGTRRERWLVAPPPADFAPDFAAEIRVDMASVDDQREADTTRSSR